MTERFRAESVDATGFGPLPPTAAPAAPAPTPAIGHNSNSAPLEELLQEASADVRQRIAERLASLARAPATLNDEETVKKVVDLSAMLRRCAKEADRIREEQKAPALATTRAIDGFFRPLRESCEQGANELDRRVTVYRNRILDQERRAREAERKAREEEQRASEAAGEPALPPAPEAPLPVFRPRGELNTVGAIRTVWKYEITGRVPLEQLRRWIEPEIDSIIAKAVRQGVRELKNVRIWPEEEVRSRG